MVARIQLALLRARLAIWSMAAAYAVSALAGLILAHCGNSFAVGQRDRIVGTALRESPITRQFGQGHRVTAAAMDAAGNAAGAIGIGVAGYFPPGAYALAAYKGWVGGIVSIDGNHRSRLTAPREALYYVAVMLLQLLPAALLGGAGVNLGFASFRAEDRTGYTGGRMPTLNIPYDALRDAAWIVLLTLPLFFLASLVEFLA